MKKGILVILALLAAFTFCSCVVINMPSLTPAIGASPSAEGETASTAPSAGLTASPAASPAPSPAAAFSAEEPDAAGDGTILFNIYRHRALADLNGDGVRDEIAFTAGDDLSKITVNGVTYHVMQSGLAQRFAITDINAGDGLLEIVFTDLYSLDALDEEHARSYLYWWDGKQLYPMGELIGVRFDGGWRAAYDPGANFDGNGLVMCTEEIDELTIVSYIAHYVASGPGRTLTEEPYLTAPIYSFGPMVLKNYLVLLNQTDTKYVRSDYFYIWEYAGGYGTVPRDTTDDIVAFIPQAGEVLRISRMYGRHWYEMQADDGKTGWLWCEYGCIQGIYQAKGYIADDIFSGLGHIWD